MPSNVRRGLEGAPENRVVGAKPKTVWSAARHAPVRKGEPARRDLLETLRASLLDGPHAAILCAAPGMGKTVLAEALKDEWVEEGRGAVATYLDGMEASRAITRIGSIVRRYAQIKSLRKGTLFVVDGLPAGDDYQAEKMATLLRKLIDAGMALIVTMRPEAEQICEFFPDACCLGSRELTVAFEDRHAWGGEAASDEQEFEASTRGIPALIDRLSAASEGGSFGWSARDASETLAEMVSVGIRSTLMDEERRVRLAMMLLGEASFGELAAAVPRLDDAILAGLEQEEPFFGVDSSTAGFRCAGLGDLQVLAACLPALRPYAGEEADAVEAVCEVLAKEGRIGRMAAIAEGLLPPARCTRLMMRWPAELADAGLAGSLRTAISHFDETEANARERFCLGISKIAVACISGKTEGCAEIRASLEFPIDARERTMLAQADAFLNALAGGRAQDVAGPSAGCDAIVENLRSHARIRGLIFSGDYEEAFRQAVLSVRRHAEGSLSASLLSDDLGLIRLLTGDAEPESEDCRRIGSFPSGQGYQNLRRIWTASVEAARAMRGGPYDEEAVDEGIKAAQLRGDLRTAAVFLLTEAALDIAGSAYARATVRAGQAGAFARAESCEHLALEADALVALAERCAGGFRCRDAKELDGIAQTRPECALAMALAGPAPKKADAYAELLCTGGLRASALPLLRSVALLSRRQLLPPMPELSDLWARAVDDRSPIMAAPVEAMLEATAAADDRPLFEAAVLDVFSVRREGVPIPESAWKRQAARTLLALLCAAKGHELSRASICTLIWPGRDFSVARSSLYSALSALKRALGQRVDGPQMIVAREGRVVLDPSLVNSDVDRLVFLAGRMLLQKDDDAKLVERGRELVLLKPESLPCIESDTTGIMVARQAELAELYTDAMLVGGEAALRMGLAPVALRFALEAASFDSVREDVELLALRAFAAAGRETEARSHYERFSRAVIELTEAPPSPMMRKEAARICGKARRLPSEPSVEETLMGKDPEDPQRKTAKARETKS